MLSLYTLLSLSVVIPYHHGYNQLGSLTNSLLEEVAGRMGGYNILPDDYDINPLIDYDFNINSDTRNDEQQKMFDTRVMKDHGNHLSQTRNGLLFGREPTTRDLEHLEHSSLFGHQFMQGGAGEGFQRLKPDGSAKNQQILKTDIILPAYCDPPNPCPLGYSSKDGCLEQFENTAAFSREYQEAEDCMCDPDHMFECPEVTNEDRIDIPVELLTNGNIMNGVLNQLSENVQIEGQHKNLIAKKFFINKQEKQNPYLLGKMLPVVAKKSPKEK